jgi:hypothetical protein
MRRINSMVWGIVLLLLGVLLTLDQLNFIDITSGMAFSIILLSLSVLFHLYYFFASKGNEGLLVPGGILLVYGLMFLASTNSSIFNNGLWPLLILGPALGIFELYVFSRGQKGSMIPVFILTAVGGCLLLRNFTDIPFTIVLAIVLIGIGAALMISSILKSTNRDTRSFQQPPVVEVKVEADQGKDNNQSQ